MITIIIIDDYGDNDHDGYGDNDYDYNDCGDDE